MVDKLEINVKSTKKISYKKTTMGLIIIISTLSIISFSVFKINIFNIENFSIIKKEIINFFNPNKLNTNVYKTEVKINLNNFHGTILCATDIVNLSCHYKLFNVMFELPTAQKSFVKNMNSDQDIIIGYFNDDKSEAYIPTKYRLSKNYEESETCFFISFNNYDLSNMSIRQGPKFKTARYECFERLSGETGFLDEWIPNE